MKRHHLTLGGFVWPLLAAALIWTLVLHQYSLKSGFGFLLAALMIGWPLLAMLLWSLPSLLLGMVTTPQQRAARRKRRKDAGHDRSNPIRAWVRRAAFRADRYRCVYCRQKFRRGRGLEADHYWPYSCGGLANIFNVFALCKYHNDVKSNYWVDPDGYVHYRPYMVHSDPVLAAAILAAERRHRRNPLRWLRAAWALAW